MRFASRQDAGRKLAGFLLGKAIQADMVAGIPRGGVVVAVEIANTLRLPLEVLIVRKIGHPLQREFAVGALAEGGIILLDERDVGLDPIIRRQLEEVIREETARLRDYELKFHGDQKPDFHSRRVMLVDDGLATGATTEAAVLSARKQGASRVIVVAPVASTTAVERLARVADDVIVLIADRGFGAVGAYYQSFDQTTDEEVLALLHHAHCC